MACRCDKHIIVYFAEYFVAGYWRMIVVVLICELDITKEDYTFEQKVVP